MVDALDAAALAAGRLVFRYRDYLAPVAVLAALAACPPRQFLGSPTGDLWLDALGVLIALCGQTLRVLVIGMAYIQRGGDKKRIAASTLVCEGFFAHCRNPLYVGNFLLVSGLTIIWNSELTYLFILPILGGSLLTMVRAEEAFLRQKFGAEYAAYCQRVNRFIPSFAGFGATLSKFDFDWKRVVRKEYGTTFAWMSIALLLIAVERIQWIGWEGAQPLLGQLAAVWCVLLALWGVARWLKKSERLASAAGN